ncbi:MAG: hypothetical protein H6563_12830 [Lewinellaceae bacterium]|nr:hypothetical protein [Lewinellaceae bacterium]
MKRILFVFALIGFASFAVQAQTCCSKAAKGTSAKTETSCSESAAVKAASLDDSIEQRVDANTGKVSFVRRSVDASTGEATYIPVEYCNESKSFKTAAAEKASCDKEGAKAGCCAEGKAGSAGGACCAKDSKAKSSSTSIKLNKTNN